MNQPSPRIAIFTLYSCATSRIGALLLTMVPSCVAGHRGNPILTTVIQWVLTATLNRAYKEAYLTYEASTRTDKQGYD